MQEMPADSGEVIVAKGKTLGYLAQHQEVSGDNTIYGELLSVKQYLLDMEEKIRTMEQQMKTLTGRELDELLASYSRLTHLLELEGGYACRSEVVGVLITRSGIRGRRIFKKDRHIIRRTENPCGARTSAVVQPGYNSS